MAAHKVTKACHVCPTFSVAITKGVACDISFRRATVPRSPKVAKTLKSVMQQILQSCLPCQTLGFSLASRLLRPSLQHSTRANFNRLLTPRLCRPASSEGTASSTHRKDLKDKNKKKDNKEEKRDKEEKKDKEEEKDKEEKKDKKKEKKDKKDKEDKKHKEDKEVKKGRKEKEEEAAEDDRPMEGSAGESANPKMFFLDKFALRQWRDPEHNGTRIQSDPEDFVRQIETFYASGAPLVPGYAPFCKHLFVPNFVNACVNTLPVTEENIGLLRSGYRARTSAELPVLIRWFPAELVAAPVAKMLDVILYSREQLEEEYKALASKTSDSEVEDLPPGLWGIISIKAQNESEELPMQPITMMRNALGKSEGGSGVPLEKTEYLKSVEYWEQHASII